MPSLVFVSTTIIAAIGNTTHYQRPSDPLAATGKLTRQEKKGIIGASLPHADARRLALAIITHVSETTSVVEVSAEIECSIRSYGEQGHETGTAADTKHWVLQQPSHCSGSAMIAVHPNSWESSSVISPARSSTRSKDDAKNSEIILSIFTPRGKSSESSAELRFNSKHQGESGMLDQ